MSGVTRETMPASPTLMSYYAVKELMKSFGPVKGIIQSHILRRGFLCALSFYKREAYVAWQPLLRETPQVFKRF